MKKHTILFSKVLFLTVIVVPFFISSCSSKVEYSGLRADQLDGSITTVEVVLNLGSNELLIKNEFGNLKGFLQKNNTIELTNLNTNLVDTAFVKFNTDEISIEVINPDHPIIFVAKNKMKIENDYLSKLNAEFINKRNSLSNEQITKILKYLSIKNKLNEIILRNNTKEIKNLEPGSVIFIFDKYNGENKQICDDDPVKQMYEGEFVHILEQQKPFLVSVSNNRSNNINNNRTTISVRGKVIYDSGKSDNNKDNEVSFTDFRFFYFDPITFSIKHASFGYRVGDRVLFKVYGSYSTEYARGVYSFYANQWLRILDGSKLDKFIISDILPKLECDYLSSKQKEQGYITIATIDQRNEISWVNDSDMENKPFCLFSNNVTTNKGTNPSFAELYCYPKDVNKILYKPDQSAIHDSWPNGTGLSWSFIAKKRIENEKGVFLMGDLISPRGGSNE